MPFPSTTVVPAGWSKHHQSTAAGGMNAVCELRGPSTSTTYDPATMSSTSTPGPLEWSGRCRVQALVGDARAGDQAGQDVTTRAYLVQLDETSDALPDIVEDWTVTVTVCANDAYLIGRPLAISDVQYGSERFTRDVLAVDNLG